MSHGRLLLLIALAAIAVELFALRPVLIDRDGPIDDSQVMYGLIGCSFVAFGLVAWGRRPDSRAGMLMAAAGFSFFVALLLSLLTHGRLQSRFDRLLVASYAVPMWVVPFGHGARQRPARPRRPRRGARRTPARRQPGRRRHRP